VALGGCSVDAVKEMAEPGETICEVVMIDGSVISDAKLVLTVAGVTDISSMLCILFSVLPFTVAVAVTRYLPAELYECVTLYSLPDKSVAEPVAPSPKLNVTLADVPPEMNA
jgi:hypothetical protein